MREYTAPAMVTITDEMTTVDTMFANAEQVPDRAILRYKVGDEFADITAARFRDLVVGVGAGLVAAGIRPGDTVGLMSRTRYEWTVLDYAIWAAGAVTVPIYETSSADQVEWILSDAGVVLALVESDAHAAIVNEVRGRIPALREVLVIDGGALDALTRRGVEAGVGPGDLAKARADMRADSLATIIYTSGTTGRPKGCEITHRALVFNAKASIAMVPELFRDAATLMFLPLAHVLARTMQTTVITAGSTMAFAPDTTTLLPDLAKTRPTYLLGVPRVFEKIHAGARTKAHAAGKGKIFDAAEETAVAYSRALDRGGPELLLRLKHAVFDHLVYRKLRTAMGGQAMHAVSGGAPLGERLSHFFRGIGFIVLEGWGLTETTAAATVNRLDKPRMGTVGPPLPGVTVRIADDGEILIAGPLLLRAYHNNETATKEAIDQDGFLHTGDIGSLDDEGNLRITGRKKELLVTAGGKNIAPAPLEHLIQTHPLISQAMLIGDQRPFIAALITIDPDRFPEWREGHGKPADASVADLVDDPDLRAEVQRAIDEANRMVSQAERIKKFTILPGDFTVESGELTPSLKVRRSLVMERHAAAVREIYS